MFCPPGDVVNKTETLETNKISVSLWKCYEKLVSSFYLAADSLFKKEVICAFVTEANI